MAHEGTNGGEGEKTWFFRRTTYWRVKLYCGFGYLFVYLSQFSVVLSLYLSKNVIRSRKKEKNLENRCQEERILRDKSWVSTNIVSDYPLENEIILWFVVLDSFFFFVIKINIS